METIIAPPTMGAKIRSARKRRGLTQDELAEKSLCSRQTICNAENDHQQLSGAILRRIARALKTKAEKLWVE